MPTDDVNGAFLVIGMILYLKSLTYSRHGKVSGSFNRDFIARGLFTKDLWKAPQ